MKRHLVQGSWKFVLLPKHCDSPLKENIFLSERNYIIGLLKGYKDDKYKIIDTFIDYNNKLIKVEGEWFDDTNCYQRHI